MHHNHSSHFIPHIPAADALAALRGRADVGHCLECGHDLVDFAAVLCAPCLAEAEAEERAMDESDDIAALVAKIVGGTRPALRPVQLAMF